MIPTEKKIAELTWGEIISDLDERYGKASFFTSLERPASEFLNIKQCAAVTGYKENYIRQLIFKRAIPFYKTANLKPVRFKKCEILAWMSERKFTPIQEQAEDYLQSTKIKTKL
jgi:predicted DNA-binding transcriptional regulator AlpA